MPRYFLDYFDGSNDQVDVGGTDYHDDEAAKAAARAMLAERACLEILRGGDIIFCVRVRCKATPIFSVTLSTTEETYRLDS